MKVWSGLLSASLALVARFAEPGIDYFAYFGIDSESFVDKA